MWYGVNLYFDTVKPSIMSSLDTHFKLSFLTPKYLRTIYPARSFDISRVLVLSINLILRLRNNIVAGFLNAHRVHGLLFLTDRFGPTLLNHQNL